MKRKLLSLFVAAMLLLSVFPSAVLAQSAKAPAPKERDNVIDIITITGLDIPTWGAHPDLNASVPDDSSYSIRLVQWLESAATEGQDPIELTAEDTFSHADRQYFVGLIVAANEGYTLAQECSVAVNGSAKLVQYGTHLGDVEEYLVMAGPFTVAEPPAPSPTPDDGYIRFVEINDFTVPAWGEAPSYDISVPEGANYYISEVQWWYRGDGAMNMMPDGMLFDNEDYRYFAIIDLLPNDGYQFDNTLEGNLTAVINTVDGGTEQPGSYGFVNLPTLSILTRNFAVTAPTQPTPTPTLINSVEITDLVIPEYGEAPVYTVSVPEGAPYTVDRVEWYARNGGFLLGNVPGAVFDDTTESYEATIILTPAEGYAFADTVTATINGETGLVERMLVSSGELGVVSVGFTVEPPATPSPTTPAPSGIPIETVELLNFVAPVWGAEPSSGVTVPEGANYTIEEQGWYYYAGTLFPLQPGDRFVVEGRLYSMMFTIVPDEGYYLVKPDSLVVTINGSEDLVGSVFVFGGESARIDTVDFTVESPIVIDTIEINGFVVPTWGASPDYGITVPTGANYRISSVDWSYSANGTDWEPMGPGAAFDNEAFLYLMGAYFLPDDGYMFSDELTFKINGGTELVMYSGLMGDMAWLETQLFTVEAPAAFIWGDANGDGEVTSADSVLITRHAMGVFTLEEPMVGYCDVNGDGLVDVVDAILVLRFSMGLIESLPV